MAKTAGRRTREEVYDEILRKTGLKLENCEILAYKFDNEGRQVSFHYKLMRAGVMIRIYDAMGAVVRVIVDAGSREVGKVEGLAREAGGQRI